jgi:hypothetical protein
MSRSPRVILKMEAALSRSNAVYDTTMGWRAVNKRLKAQNAVLIEHSCAILHKS